MRNGNLAHFLEAFGGIVAQLILVGARQLFARSPPSVPVHRVALVIDKHPMISFAEVAVDRSLDEPAAAPIFRFHHERRFAVHIIGSLNSPADAGAKKGGDFFRIDGCGFFVPQQTPVDQPGYKRRNLSGVFVARREGNSFQNIVIRRAALRSGQLPLSRHKLRHGEHKRSAL